VTKKDYLKILVVAFLAYFMGQALTKAVLDEQQQTIEVSVPAPVVNVAPSEPVIVEKVVVQVVEVEKQIIVEKQIFVPAPQTNPHVEIEEAVSVRRIFIHAEWELEVPHLWEVDPPARIDIIMWPDHMQIYKESAQTRCENMGGELIYNPAQQQLMCEDVDY